MVEGWPTRRWPARVSAKQLSTCVKVALVVPVMTLTIGSPIAFAARPDFPPVLSTYCDAVRAELNADEGDPPIDPRQVSATSKLQLPALTRILDQEIKAASRRAGAEGDVGLGIVVTEAGRALFVRVLRGSGHGQLDSHAVSMFSEAGYAPGRIDDIAIAMCVYAKITFRLDSRVKKNAVTILPP